MRYNYILLGVDYADGYVGKPVVIMTGSLSSCIEAMIIEEELGSYNHFEIKEDNIKNEK